MNTTAIKKFDRMIQQAIDIAEKAVIDAAREILSRHPELHEFIMAMGGWSFTLNHNHDCYWDASNCDNGDEYWGDEEGDVVFTCPEAIREFSEFIDKFSDVNITGSPMRFTATSAVKTKW